MIRVAGRITVDVWVTSSAFCLIRSDPPTINFLLNPAGVINLASDNDLDERISKLSSSYLTQGKAILAKTCHIQKRRLCSNCCMCFCPALSILICLLLQWGLVEMLLFKDGMINQRCTYCGPDDAWGKVYCEGKPCFEYFWNDDNPDTATKWRKCSADSEPFASFKVGS